MAHGLTARADLPLPRWLFVWGAAVVLVISFLALAVLWPKPKLENAGRGVIPGSRFLTSRAVEIVCGAIGVAILCSSSTPASRASRARARTSRR